MARFVKKVFEIDEVLSKREDQGMELKRIKYVTVTKICILIISTTVFMALAVVSWGTVIGYLQEILVWIYNFFP